MFGGRNKYVAILSQAVQNVGEDQQEYKSWAKIRFVKIQYSLCAKNGTQKIDSFVEAVGVLDAMLPLVLGPRRQGKIKAFPHIGQHAKIGGGKANA